MVPETNHSTKPLGAAWIAPLHAKAVRSLQERGVPFHLAEDAAQDICLAAWQQFGTRAPPAVWLAALVRNKAADYVRGCLSDRTHIAKLAGGRNSGESTSTNPSENDAADLLLLLQGAVARLDSAHREVVLGFYFLGQSLAQIAAAAQINHATARKRLSRARVAVASYLGSRTPAPAVSPL